MIDSSKLKAGVVVKIVGNKTATVSKTWSKKYPNWVTMNVKEEGKTRQINIADILEITEFKNITNVISGKGSLCSYAK